MTREQAAILIDYIARADAMGVPITRLQGEQLRAPLAMLQGIATGAHGASATKSSVPHSDFMCPATISVAGLKELLGRVSDLDARVSYLESKP